ncbi:MAG: MMPL family transporter [Archangium sp.]
MNPRLTYAWSLIFALLVGHQIYLWRGGLKVESDLLELLPRSERDELAEVALRNLADSASKQVIILITGKDSRAEAERFTAALKTDRLKPVPLPDSAGAQVIDALMPHRDRLLTAAQRHRLETEPVETLANNAMLALQQPMSQRIGDFRDDPLQLFPEFLRESASRTRLRPVNGYLTTGDSVLLRYEVIGSAMALDGEPKLKSALDVAKAAVTPGTEVLLGGVPLFAESASVRANAEVSTVGFGSLAAIMLIMFFAFRSPRPLILVVLSVGSGVAAGLSACALLFGKVHLMTLVFGASLVGVAEDYGIHYFASRQARPNVDRHELLKHLTPGLFLALLTSVAGYVMLAITPMPGLRQVALFSGVGLVAAFLTVLAWFPLLDRGTVKPTRFANAWAASRAKWPTLRGAPMVIFVVVTLGLGGAGIARLQPSDDVRGLQSSPPELLEAQKNIAIKIGLPSPAQFFLVRGANEGERLQNEEALRAKLDVFIGEKKLQGYDAVSSWVPSPKRQLENRELIRKTSTAVLTALKDELEEDIPPPLETKPLEVSTLLGTAVGAAIKPLWLADASVVMLHAPSREALEEFSKLDALPGVHFVDRTGDISALMKRWRVGMTELLVGGYVVIFAALFFRFRRRAWRALVPTFIASVMALGLVGFLGEPLSLFHVLALWLLLAMGVDYGIFLLEHEADQGEAWLAVGLGAVSTLLSFGLLAVSSTQAIHAFGVTLGAGVTIVWLMSPLFVPMPEKKVELNSAS